MLDADIKLDRDGLKAQLLEIMSHLGAARMQSQPGDDQIIARHVVEAHAIAQALYRCS